MGGQEIPPSTTTSQPHKFQLGGVFLLPRGGDQQNLTDYHQQQQPSYMDSNDNAYRPDSEGSPPGQYGFTSLGNFASDLDGTNTPIADLDGSPAWTATSRDDLWSPSLTGNNDPDSSLNTLGLGDGGGQGFFNTLDLYQYYGGSLCNGSGILLWNLENWSFGANCSFNESDIEDLPFAYKHPALGALLAIFALFTVFGNMLVILAVARERYLRTVTNYFIVSLAIADTVIGAVVMPFSIIMEMTNQVWFFGSDWCDVWHSFDVLASTASILNLSVISLDRYWAITNPISYPSKMSTGRAFVLIALVWICSAAISFPAILWWRSVSGEKMPPHVCAFTEDTGYLIFSSLVSFYCPISVIMFAYYKIYVAASEQTRSLKTGSKVMSSNGVDGEVMTLRIHRGGGHRYADEHYQYARAANSDSETDSPSHLVRSHDDDGDVRPSRMISRKWKHFALSRKLSKLAKEQKAAKTLGIVMGVFCICWVPFFVTNVLYGICKTDCVRHGDVLFPIFTWLGYLNSGMNPVIYALSMRDFRRAFAKVLLACCPRYRILRTRRHNYETSMSSSSYMLTCGDRCVNVKL